MITRMKKINIEGPKSDLRNVVDTLKSTGAFELNIHNSNKETVDEASTERGLNLSNIRGRIKAVLDILSQKPIDATREIKYDEFKKVAQQEQTVITAVEKIEGLRDKQFELKAEIENTHTTIEELKPYLNLNIAFNILHDTKSAFVLTGLINTEQFEKFKSDYYLDNFTVSQCLSTNGRTCVVYVGMKTDEPIIRMIYDYGFERCKFNFSVTAKQKIKELDELMGTLRKEMTEVQQKTRLPHETVLLLRTYYDYLTSELDTESILNNTLQTESSFLINGWVAENAQEQVVTLLKNINRKIQIKVNDAKEFDTPPVLISNPKIIRPYQSITNLYGEPGLRDIDPNYFVAFFYFLFFGLMIGDIGYGIIMFATALIVLLVFKPQRGAKDLIAIICMGGISAVLWGIFFGSFFGAETSDGILKSIFPAAVINPIEDALVFLVLALALGVAHIIVGLVLKFYNLLRQHRIIDALCDALVRIVLFAGLIMFAIGLMVEQFAVLKTVGMVIAVSAVVLIVLTAGRKNKGIFGKITGGFGGLYSLINYASDILSYARLFGLGLVGAVIAMVANLMGGMLIGIPILGWPLGILVAIFFHIFNLAIGLLSAYVHNARLQFIEFFGKFYEGGGRTFVPLGSNLKYVKIISVLENK